MENLQFKNEILVSLRKQIVVFAKLEVPEDIVTKDVDATCKSDNKTVEYNIYQHTFEIQDKWQVNLILFQSSQHDILERLQTGLVGDYLCYREFNEDKINYLFLSSANNLESDRGF